MRISYEMKELVFELSKKDRWITTKRFNTSKFHICRVQTDGYSEYKFKL